MRFVRPMLLVLAVSLLPAATAQASNDKVVITGSTTVAPAETAGDVVVIDGPVAVAGHVTGDLVSLNGRVTISGRVDGDVIAVSKRATLLPGARVGGDLSYGGDKPVIAPTASVGGKVSNEGWNDLGSSGVQWVVLFAFWLAVTVSMLLLGLVLLWLVPRAADAAWAAARDRTGTVAGWAAGLFVGIPILVIAAVASVLGLPLGLGLLLAVMPLAALGYVTGCYLLGRRVAGAERGRIAAFLIGFAILRVIALIPGLGTLGWVLASAFGLAALVISAWYAGDRGRGAPPAQQPRPAGEPAA